MDKANMHYRAYPVPASLKGYVRYFWSFDSRQTGDGELRIQNLADRYPRLIFQDMEGFAPIRSATGEVMPVTYLSGMDTCRTDAVMGLSWSHVGVSFYPHGLKRFFKIDAQELVNRLPDIQYVGEAGLSGALLAAGSPIERIGILSEFLYRKLQQHKKEDSLINHLILHQAIDKAADIHQVQKAYHITERQLERRFKEQVGVSPKKFQRMARFEKALHLLQHTAYRQLTGLAYALGYADQAHFIKEFQSFSGLSPYAFVKTEKVGAESASFLVQG
jgi:AraC-like DNA-binding protein